MNLKILGVRIMIHLNAERQKSDLRKLVREFREAYHECLKLTGEHVTAEDFAKACAMERAERQWNKKTRKV